MSKKMTVLIVVDPDFGDRLSSLADKMPVWIADTPPNRTMAESSWKGGNANITTFRVVGDDPGEWCQLIIPQVLLHHGENSQFPPIDSIEVFGTSSTKSLRDAFSKHGFTISSKRPDGFRATRGS
jgi:hypothetical protein